MTDGVVDDLVAALKVVRQGKGISNDAHTLAVIPRELRPALGCPAGPESVALQRLLDRFRQSLARLTEQDQQVLVEAFNVNGQSAFGEFLDRLDMIASRILNKSSSTARREVDSATRRLAVEMCSGSPLIDSPYSLDLGEFTDRVTADGLDHVHVIVGSSERERTGEASAFNKTEFSATEGQASEKFSRQTVPGTMRDLLRVADLVAVLTRSSDRQGRAPTTHELCVSEVAVPEEMLADHLIMVGGADTNLLIALAAMKLVEVFGDGPPIRYAGESQRYFTCDEIDSRLSGKRYPRLEEKGGMHCGYIVHAKNPWNADRTLTIVSGTRATGTQAALLSLVLDEDELVRRGLSSEPWRRLGANNRYRPEYSAKVVRASRARIVDSLRPIGSAQEVEVTPYERISQRHAITDFVYEE